MPIPLPVQTLRGIYAALVRSGNTSPSVFTVNKRMTSEYPGVYVPPTGAAIRAVEEALRDGPFPTAGMVEYGIGYWYNYFFKELPNLQKPDFVPFAVNDDGTFRDEATSDLGAGRTWKMVFDAMLKLGFKEFQARDHLTASEALAHAAKGDGNPLQASGVQVLFRGDGRLPDTIEAQGGTARQSQVESLRRARNMDKWWHPFRRGGHKVWVRNGANTDNCLFSTVSITPQFEVATKFPLLNDLRGSNPAAIGHAVVLVRPRGDLGSVAKGPKLAQNYLSGLSDRSSGGGLVARTMLASRTNIYCVRMRDVYNTQNYQGQSAFPEYATTRISWMDHLVWFAVTRIHFSDVDGNAGHLAVVTDHKWLSDPTILRQVLLKGAALGILEAFVSDTVRRGSLTSGTGGIVVLPPGVEPPDFEIVTVQRPFVPGPPPQKPDKISIPTAFKGKQ